MIALAVLMVVLVLGGFALGYGYARADEPLDWSPWRRALNAIRDAEAADRIERNRSW